MLFRVCGSGTAVCQIHIIEDQPAYLPPTLLILLCYGERVRERESCKVLQLLPKNKINEKDDLLLTMTHVNRSSLEQSRPVLYYYEGRFTSWTMKLDHGRWPFSVVPFFIKKSNYKAFGPLKPSVDQETMYPKMNMLIQKKCICPQKWHF